MAYRQIVFLDWKTEVIVQNIMEKAAKYASNRQDAQKRKKAEKGVDKGVQDMV